MHSRSGRCAAEGLQLDLMPPGDAAFAALQPRERVASPSFAAALYDIWLSPDTPVTGAREQWAQALRTLLQQTA